MCTSAAHKSSSSVRAPFGNVHLQSLFLLFFFLLLLHPSIIASKKKKPHSGTPSFFFFFSVPLPSLSRRLCLVLSALPSHTKKRDHIKTNGVLSLSFVFFFFFCLFVCLFVFGALVLLFFFSLLFSRVVASPQRLCRSAFFFF